MRAMRAFFLGLLLAGAMPATAQDWWEAGLPKGEATPVRQMAIREEKHGRTLEVVDWEKARIVVRAMGTADPRTAVNMAQMEILAEEAARVMAQFRLAEAVKGLHLTAETTVHNAMLQDQTVTSRVEAYLQGVQYGEPKRITMPDGSVQVEIAASITFDGKGGLREVLPLPPPGPRHIPAVRRLAAKPAPPTPYTGLIIDASGLGLENGLYPRVLTEGGAELYGVGTIDAEAAQEIGPVGYAASLDRARLQTGRVGDNPLELRAVSVAGRVNVVLGEDHVGDVEAAKAYDTFLRDGAVVFVNR